MRNHQGHQDHQAVLVRREPLGVLCGLGGSMSFFIRVHPRTLSHCPVFADESTASQTRWVSSASRNVGPAGFPSAKPCRKSATWCTKVCSYPICKPGTHQFFM